VKQPLGLIYNPTAGQGRFRPGIQKVLQALDDAGAHVELFATRLAGDGIEQGRLAALAHETVAIYGGDGTVNEVLNGLVESGKSSRVLLLPGGTMNVLCRELRIPLNVDKAAALLSSGVGRHIYLGLATTPQGKRYFSLMAGAGIDAAVVHGMSHFGWAKRLIGPFAFLVAGLEQMFRYRFPELEVEVDGSRFPGRGLVVGKSKGYGGFFTMTGRADPHEPIFEVALAERRGLIRHSFNLMLAMVGLIKWSPNHRFFMTTHLTAKAVKRVPVQMDGDATGGLAGESPIEFSIDGTTVEVLVEVLVP
jgi:diacylglycerol kinase family enzyme